MAGVYGMRYFLILWYLTILLGCDSGSQRLGDLAIGNATDVAQEQYETEFENDYVKIVRVRYEPGEVSEIHRHGRMVGVHLTDVSSMFTDPKGNSERRDGIALVPFETPNNDTHSATNLLDTPTESVFVELKQSYEPTLVDVPNAFESNSDVRQLLLEGEGYRVIKTKYEKDMFEPLHSHNAKVAIFINDAHFKEETTGGHVLEQLVKAGEARWGDETSHKVTNLGDRYEVLLIELL